MCTLYIHVYNVHSIYHERVTEPVPLVWDLPAAPRDPRTRLSQETITEAAIRIADAEGDHAVTMRRVARDLGSSTPMSLYRYVGGKEGILDLMIDEVYRRIGLPESPEPDWRAAMTTLAGRTRTALRAHPWFSALSHQRPPFGPHALRHSEWSLAALDRLGLVPATAMSVAGMVFGYAVSYAQNEAEEERMRRRIGVRTDAELRATAERYVDRIAADPRYPRLARWISEGGGVDPDAQFTLGLDCLLDGIERRIVTPAR
jgi:AcrR family transcriptional regulator